MVVKSDGAIWFTDPSYAHLQGFGPEPRLGDHVYCVRRRARARRETGSTSPTGSRSRPTSRALRRRQRALRDRGVRRRSTAACSPTAARFATIERGFPDGLKTDRRGNVYTTGGAGLLVFSPAGALLREIDLPGAVNFAFAGDRLLVTADDAIWSIPLQGA